MTHGYRYVGEGERWRGVPSRDLTQDDYDRLGPLEQRTVTESGAWEPVTVKPADKPDTSKAAGNGGGDD